MKKVLVALAAVSIVAVLSGGAIGSGAWFTDQDSVETNEVLLGALNPMITGAPFYVENAEPGVAAGTQELRFVNSNLEYPTPTIAVKYRITAEYMSGDPQLYDQIGVRAQWHNGSSWQTAYDGPLSTMDINPTNWGPTANLPVGATHLWRFTYTPASTLDNLFQGHAAVFRLVFNSTQTANPGWDQ